MAIINKISVVVKDEMNNDFHFNRISRFDEPYYYIVYGGNYLYIKTSEPVTGNTETIYDIIGADTIEELEQIIIDLGLMDNIE